MVDLVSGGKEEKRPCDYTQEHARRALLYGQTKEQSNDTDHHQWHRTWHTKR
jgi:hypothetical protein